jgi:hypothetical protein
MMAQCWHGVRQLRLVGKILLSGLMVCCLTDVACSQGKSRPAYDVRQHHLERIPPGTVLGKEAPKGWTNLIIKSYSRPGAGDTKQLSPLADRLSRLLFTAILADVKTDKSRGDKRYRLAKVAVGLGVRIGDKDTIVTPETERRLGAGLGLLARVVLRTAQEKLADIVVLARSGTLMIFDSPSFIVREDKHKPIVLRYAVLVDASSGQLDTLVWVLDREEGERGAYGGPFGAIQWLPANLNEDCILHVDGAEFSLGQPTEKAFAMTEPPKGKKEIAVSDELKSLVAQRRFSPTMAADLENKLREALKQANKN